MYRYTRASKGWWLLQLSAKMLALLRLSVKFFFQLRSTKKLKISFFCFKELNITKPVFFLSLKYSTSNIIFLIEMSIVNLKIIFVKKQK